MKKLANEKLLEITGGCFICHLCKAAYNLTARFVKYVIKMARYN